MLADYFQDVPFKSLNLEILAQKWMDVSYEVREAAQSLLKNELKRIGPNGRSALIKFWEPHLSSLLKECEDVTNTSHVSLSANTGSGNNVTAMISSSSSISSNLSQQQQHNQATPSTNQTANQSTLVDAQQINLPPNIQQQHGATESLTRLKRKQYIGLIILGVMGAEFGQDVSTSKTQTPYKTIPQGFSIDDHTILKRISMVCFLEVLKIDLKFSF
jgi:hypothetical protein